MTKKQRQGLIKNLASRQRKRASEQARQFSGVPQVMQAEFKASVEEALSTPKEVEDKSTVKPSE